MLHNPLIETPTADSEDQELVKQAQSGNREALELLIRRHQAWIYNIVVRMVYHPQDAEDATQELLIKLLTKLSTFEGRSSFLVDEARIGCSSGMLLCLDREQRLIYILGEIFGITDAVGAELLEISRDNFRQKLARARRDLHSFMHNKCGLVNKANPCRCARKTQAFMKAGYLDPENLIFAREHVIHIRDVAAKQHTDLESLDAAYAEIHRDHPFHDSPDFVASLKNLINGPDFRSTLELN